jgi:hypothetical protein
MATSATARIVLTIKIIKYNFRDYLKKQNLLIFKRQKYLFYITNFRGNVPLFHSDSIGTIAFWCSIRSRPSTVSLPPGPAAIAASNITGGGTWCEPCPPIKPSKAICRRASRVSSLRRDIGLIEIKTDALARSVPVGEGPRPGALP